MTDRKNILSATKLRLFAMASGHCQNPGCLEALFPIVMGGDKHIAEMAHVIPYGEKGPRHEERPKEEFDPNSFDNLILLCPTCHTIIDKDSDAFPRGILLSWKRGHLATLALSKGIKTFDTRSEARDTVAKGLDENRAIWKKYAPIEGSEFEIDPESDVSQLWVRRMRSVILPNHYRIQSIIDANLCHATPEEKRVFAEYKEHVRGLAERHICDVAGNAIRFPSGMEGVFA